MKKILMVILAGLVLGIGSCDNGEDPGGGSGGTWTYTMDCQSISSSCDQGAELVNCDGVIIEINPSPGCGDILPTPVFYKKIYPGTDVQPLGK